MTEQMKLAIEVGMRVMVKVGAHEIPATVIEVRSDCFLVKSETSGKEFRTSRVVDILDRPGDAPAVNDPETAAEDGNATQEEPQPEEDDSMDGTTEQEDADMENQAAAQEETAENEVKVEAEAETPRAEQPDGAEETAEETEAPLDEPQEETEETPEDGEKAEAEHSAEKPKKNLSLVDAAVEVLKAEKRPMKVKELVKLATERGLWIPTKCKTPEQSLYGGLYLDMKNSASPRVKKSAEKGKFELA